MAHGNVHLAKALGKLGAIITQCFSSGGSHVYASHHLVRCGAI